MTRILPAMVALLSLGGMAACSSAQPGSRDAKADRPTTPMAPDLAQAAEPALDRMHVARASGKVGVPVEVRYLLGAAANVNQPTTLQLAFSPRVAGENLNVEFLPSDSVTIESGAAALTQQKADATGAYRRNLVITRRTAGPGEMRVIVSMDAGGGRYFGVFTIPVDEAAANLKPATRKN